jgi:signal peptidase I
MKIKSRWMAAFFSSSLLILAIIIWVFFAPTRLGGKTTYILITGNSMEPHIYQGDLVIVRASEQYQVGDIVAYRNPLIERIVFHRIITEIADTYVVQGDNNSWQDSFQPSQKDILGKEWLLLPRAGKIVEWLRKPINAALTVGILGAAFLFFGFRKTKKRSLAAFQNPQAREQGQEDTEMNTYNQPSSVAHGADASQNQSKPSFTVETGFFAVGFLALAALTVFLFSIFKPLTVVNHPEYTYTQSINYEYNAPAPSGVYDTQALVSGDPIFTSLTCQINLLVKYQIAGENLQNLEGTHLITAVISEPTSGWKRTFPLETQQVFSGESFSTLLTVDFCQLRAATLEMEKQTGTLSYNYNITIEPNVVQFGTVSNVQFLQSFNAGLPFQMDAARVFVIQENPQEDPLDQSVQSSQAADVVVQNTMGLLGLKVTVAAARILSITLLLISAAGLWLLLRQVSNATKNNKGLLAKMKYGGDMVDVDAAPALNQRSTVSVADIDNLAKIAEKLGTVILHHEAQGQHTYFVEVGGLTYLYRLEQESAIQSPPPLPAAPTRSTFSNTGISVRYQPILALRERTLEAIEVLVSEEFPQAMAQWPEQAFGNDFASPVIQKKIAATLKEQLRPWLTLQPSLNIAMHFSQKEIADLSINELTSQVAAAGLAPQNFQVEIAQQIAYNLQQRQKLISLSQNGYQIVLENNGDHINLALFDELPVSMVKLDRELFAKLDQLTNDQKLRELVTLCALRGIKVCAAGVETRSEVNQVRSLGFNCAQGMILMPPSTYPSMTTFVEGTQRR